MSPLSGIHHVTAIASDAPANVTFYTGVLGLRLVKRTVNFDDPSSYHLYYGDGTGTPGTILTFFAWPGAARGQVGAGEPTAISFSIPAGSHAWWKTRLAGAGLAFQDAGERFGELFLAFRDPDGMTVELIETERAQPHALHFWEHGPVPKPYAIRGIHSVTLAHAASHNASSSFANTAAFGADLGFQPPTASDSDGNRRRFAITGGDAGSFVDVVPSTASRRGRMGAGTIHHIAFRTDDDSSQLAWQHKLIKADYQVTEVMDRVYFRSIYFRERGGVLFEIATDPPGFTVDESEEALGSALKLPKWYEPLRSQLEASLPALPARVAVVGESV